jgi:hypothetical protein
MLGAKLKLVLLLLLPSRLSPIMLLKFLEAVLFGDMLPSALAELLSLLLLSMFIMQQFEQQPAAVAAEH